MPQDYTKDSAFMQAPRAEQIAYLKDSDKDFASASPELQRQYLDSISGMPSAPPARDPYAPEMKTTGQAMRGQFTPIAAQELTPQQRSTDKDIYMKGIVPAEAIAATAPISGGKPLAGAALGAGGGLADLGVHWAQTGQLPTWGEAGRKVGVGAALGAISPYAAQGLSKVLGNSVGGRLLERILTPIETEAPTVERAAASEAPKVESMIKSPGEFEAADRMMQLAKQRARERGMQYAAGMEPK